MYDMVKKFVPGYSYIIIFLLIIFVFNSNLSAGISRVKNYEEIDEIHQEIINLVLEASTSLESQQDLVKEYSENDFPESGKSTSLDLDFGVGTRVEDEKIYPAPQLGMNLSYPLLAPENEYDHFNQKLSFLNSKTGQTEKLEKMEKELITDLNSYITNLIELINQYQGQQQLKNKLNNRNQEVKEMVEAGMTDPENLWELDERINEIEIELNNLESRELILVNEISRNFGQERKKELKNKLKDIISLIKEVDINE